MKNVVFFSGPHGSGKTTLINKIVEEDLTTVENDFDINFLSEFKTIKVMNDFERCLLRLYHRMFVQSYANKKSSDNEKIIMVSRSVYDSFAYIDTYFQLGKISESNYEIISKIKNGLPDLPNTVILNPSIETIMNRLEKRRTNKERPERDSTFREEDTLNFVTKLHNNFEKYKNNENVLYIEDNESVERQKIYEWIHAYE